MKTKFITIALFFGLIIFFWTGCTDPVEKKITGVWLIEDISISGDTSMYDEEKFLYAIEDQKQLRFELRSDSSISINTGASEIDGIWRYDRNSKQVFVTLGGNIQPTLLGAYKDGKLINHDTTHVGTIISTIFIKEVIEKE